MKKIAAFVLFLSSCVISGPYHPIIDYIFPLPDSKFLPVKTTVILKLEESYNNKITNLSNLISVTGETSVITGTTFFAGDNRTIIFKPNQNLKYGENISVSIHLSQVGAENFQYTFQTLKTSGNELDWLGKSAVNEPPTPIKQDVYPVRLINGIAVPSDFPMITTNQYGETAPGRIFYATTTLASGYGNYIVICDNDGTPYFYRRYTSIPRTGDFTAHPTGVLAFHCYEDKHIVLDQNFVEIDTVYAGHGYYEDDHEFKILENGNILQVVRDQVRINMNNVVTGGQPNATVEGHHFQEMDKDQNVIFEWRAWDFLDIRDTYVNIRDTYTDFVHMNSIAIDYDDNYIISPREFHTIMKINRKTGEVMWTLGGRHSDFEFINDNLKFSYQHDANPVVGKPNHYLLFDNGRDRSPQISRAVEYKLDLGNMTAEKVWEYRHDPDWYSGWMGSAQRLPNGNTLVEFPGGRIRAVEVTADGEVVWEMFVVAIETYRCRRYEWEGKMPYPYLILENLGSVVRLIFNKFGDPNVNFYRIYVGTNSDNLTPLADTDQTWYDIDARTLNNGTQYYFGVTAVYKNGHEGEFSSIENTLVATMEPGENAIKNGGFDTPDLWELEESGDASATGQINTDGYYQINITNGGSDAEHVQLRQDNIIIMRDNYYTFEFDAYASETRAIEAKVISGDSRQTNYGRIGITALTSRLKHFKYEFEMTRPTDVVARVVFNCGGQPGEVYIDNVSLTFIGNELQPLASPWQSTDIGQPLLAGTAGMRQDRFVLRGSGADIWDNADAFHFVYQKIKGDAEITARVVSVENSDPWSKAGVMIRNSLTPGSQHAMMILSSQNGIAFQRRTTVGGTSVHTAGTQTSAPYWVRLTREGDKISAWESPNGTTWRRIGVQTITMDEEIYFGMPVTSHADGVICEAELDNVSLITAAFVDNNFYSVPDNFELYPAFPNPFNPETVINFALPKSASVRLEVFDIHGRKVRTLFDGNKLRGRHEIIWNGSDDAGTVVASGLYFIRMQSERFDRAVKVTFLR
ncbi:aryl-sulfate sulfotransferase [candidate division KSB1 bacterium]|nr:aryl-sulfate sulfotransferase [candidate division KSB1 bacterium]